MIYTEIIRPPRGFRQAFRYHAPGLSICEYIGREVIEIHTEDPEAPAILFDYLEAYEAKPTRDGATITTKNTKANRATVSALLIDYTAERDRQT